MDRFLEKIISKSVYRREPKNTILLKEGELSKTFVHLKSGIIRHYFTDADGNDLTKNFLVGPCNFLFSMSSFISQTPGIVQCEALTEVEIYEMNYENFQKMLKDHEFLSFWNSKLINFILKKERKEIALIRDDATKRYLQFLKDFPGLLNKIPHYYIASYLSISPETLSRIRKNIS